MSDFLPRTWGGQVNAIGKMGEVAQMAGLRSALNKQGRSLSPQEEAEINSLSGAARDKLVEQIRNGK